VFGHYEQIGATLCECVTELHLNISVANRRKKNMFQTLEKENSYI